MYVSDIRIHRTSSLIVPKTFIYIYQSKRKVHVLVFEKIKTLHVSAHVYTYTKDRPLIVSCKNSTCRNRKQSNTKQAKTTIHREPGGDVVTNMSKYQIVYRWCVCQSQIRSRSCTTPGIVNEMVNARYLLFWVSFSSRSIDCLDYLQTDLGHVLYRLYSVI